MKPPSENEYGKHLYQELLAIRAKRGDNEAFEEIVRTFERSMFYYVRRLVESDEDAWDVRCLHPRTLESVGNATSR